MMLTGTTAEKMPLAAAAVATLLACGVLSAPAKAKRAHERSLGGASAPTETESVEGAEGAEGSSSSSSPKGSGATGDGSEEADLNGVSFATWYGPGLFGRHTACGQVLKRRTVGVANRTLPCGTLVELRYRGRHVTVPVIDRGPYGPAGANWDLTEGAAERLHMSESERIGATIVGHVKNSPELGRGGSASRNRAARRIRGRTGGTGA
jgi:peptidoglycan lytic transglycosylase